MSTLFFHLAPDQVPAASRPNEIHVYLYGSRPVRKGTGSIGNQAKDEILRLGVAPRRVATDLLSIALAVTAADTFVSRASADDSWSRQLNIVLPLADPLPWRDAKADLERALAFLSGDTWNFTFEAGGRPPPTQFEVKTLRRHLNLSTVDRVSLFSGGLDSGIATILMLKDKVRPLLVSHAYTGDASYQDDVAALLSSQPQRFSLNAHPEMDVPHEDSMRSRSFNFLAFGVLAADTLSTLRSGANIDLFVPENGLIALNAPLTPRRMGALSTRTTHPYFLGSIQQILDQVGLRVRISNPFELMTKGEMVAKIADEPNAETFASSTVSCGKWKRAGQQCGRCVPCLIRRASLYAGGLDDGTDYGSPDLAQVVLSEEHRDDLVSMMTAVLRLKNDNLSRWVAQAGPLPLEATRRAALLDVHRRGLLEVGTFLRDTGFRI